MLVRFTDKKGKVHWINPVHVRAVREHKSGGASIILPVSGFEGSVDVPLAVDEAAELLNAAMPLCVAGLPPPDEEPGSGDDDDNTLGGMGTALGMLG
jgi:hypothetical protein